MTEGRVDYDFAGFNDFSSNYHLIQNVVHLSLWHWAYLVKVEDEIKLTHISEILVEYLHEQMDELSCKNLTSMMLSSLSSTSMQMEKNRLAYRLHTTL